MTHFLPRSVLALLATTALTLGAQPAASAAAATLTLTPAVNDGSGPEARLILTAVHHRKHHHRAGHTTHKAAAASADDDRPAGTPGARGEVVEVPAEAVTYEVKRGDTLEKIADKLGTDVAELKRLNHIKGSSIRAGETLKGPKGEASKAYVAKSGDHAAAIAERFGVSEKALLAENDLSRKARIRAGQKLALPEGARDHAPAPEPEAAPKKSRKGAKASASRDEEESAPETSARAEGRVIETEGPARSYKVRKGDTLEKIADKLDTDVATLKKDNHLRKSMIHPGQTLKGPRSRVKAYVAGPGDTISGVAHRFGVSVEKLRAANGLSRRHTSIHAGQKLILPAGYRDHGPMAAPRREENAPQPPVRPSAQPPVRPYTPYVPPSSEPSATAPQPTTPRPYTPPTTTTPRPYTPPPSSRPYVPPSTSTPNLPSSPSGPTDAQVSELGRGRFIWPLTGEIVSDFGPKSIGQKNDGINIKANVGDSVHAAAAGDVVYAGDQVPGFGNLVLIKHADGWVTAYAHLSRVDVKMQQKVSQGQQIGLAGQTGGLSEPQLHFEVRFAPNPLDRARPVDPKLVLPQP